MIFFSSYTSGKSSVLSVVKRAVLAIVFLVLSGCSVVQDLIDPPIVSLSNIEILESSGLSIRFAIDLNIQNPNPVPIPITGLSYGLSLNGNRVLNGVTSDGINLGAYEQDNLVLEAEASLLGMLGLFRDLLSADTREIEYLIDASVGISGFSRAIEVSESGLVPLSR